jgi:hypothetical protein
VASDASDAAFEIREVNVAPVLAAIGNRTVSEGQALDFSASATDANLPAQSLRFALDPGFPAGAAIDSTTGAFHWVPDEAQGPGDFPLTIRVTDDGAPPGTTSETISIHVDEVNAPPLLSTVPVSATIPELAPYTFTATSSDPDIPVQVPVFSLVGAPAGAAIDGATGQFTWTPGEADGPGTYPFSVRVSDGVLHADVPITLTVEDVNTPPQLAGVPAAATLAELSPYTFTATATDSDLPAQELTYSLVGAPAGAAIDGSTGVFTWTPGETQGPGVYAFQVRAGDGVAATDAAIALTVEEVNAAPAITGVPAVATIPELSPYTFTASATDADLPAQTLVYSLIGAPAGAAIDGSTGEFTWTPSEAQGPGLYPFSVRVSDGTTNTDAPITLTVTEVNVAPVLSGVPAAFTIPALVVYTFTATATDADVPAQTLTFSLVGAPAGATIDGSSGVFAWTPGSDQAPGVYPFAVRVSDGTANTEASITLTVEEVTIAAIADLSAVQVNAGNPPGGTTRIQLTWSATPGGTAVEVYRAPFGAYPRYDDAGGTVPGVPTYPPPSPWTLTTVTSPGGLDSPTARDFYSYVAFVRGAGSNVSTVSNRTSGTLNYHLGDVSNGSTAGEGDNVVNTLDISLLGAHYGAAGSAVDAVAYLDVGPTTDFSTNARPTTDRLLNFEDLILFALNFQTVSAPSGTGVEEAPHRSAIATDEIYVETTGMVEPGSGISASLRMRATGAIHGLSTTLDWDAHVVRPIGHTPGGLIAQSGGMMFSPRAGTLDAVVLGAQAPGIAGEGTLGSVEFEVIAQGDPGIRIVNVQARDAGNRDLPIQPGVVGIPVRPAITVMAPARPNPFREHTAFTVSLARGASMHLAIYAVDGRLVRALAHGFREPGTYQFQWDGQDDHGRPAQSGVYFVRMTADGITSHQSIVHAR